MARGGLGADGFPKELEQEVHLWFSPTARWSDSTQAEALTGTLSPGEQDRVKRFAYEKDRRSYIAAHALLRRVLSRYHPLHPAAWNFERTWQGKPAIAFPPEAKRLRINLSHTAGMVACAVTAAGEVGVDVETVHPRDFLRIARRFFAPEETAQLEHLPPERQACAFFRFWTLKEAYIKARGEGLALDLAGFAFPDIFGEEIEIRFAEGFGDDPADWQFHRHEPEENHKIAVALHRPEHSPAAWKIFSEFP